MSTSLATELTSAAAPRTVLQAATAIELPIKTIVKILRTMCVLLCCEARNATAANGFHFAAVLFGMRLNRHGRLDVGVGIVSVEREVIGFIVEQGLTPIFQDQLRKPARLTRQLQPCLLKVI